jgi:oligoendopeptidase F
MSNVYLKARDELAKLVNTSFENNKTFSRVAGYIEVLAAELIADLPAGKRQRYIDEIRSQVGNV